MKIKYILFFLANLYSGEKNNPLEKFNSIGKKKAKEFYQRQNQRIIYIARIKEIVLNTAEEEDKIGKIFKMLNKIAENKN